MRTTSEGFTLFELVCVLVIAGALGIYATSEMEVDSTDSWVFRQEVASAVRSARNIAQSSGCEVRVSVSEAGAGYTAYYRDGGGDTDCGTRAFTALVKSPSGSTLSGTAPAVVDVVSGAVVTVDGRGVDLGGGNMIRIGGAAPIALEPSGYVHDE